MQRTHTTGEGRMGGSRAGTALHEGPELKQGDLTFARPSPTVQPLDAGGPRGGGITSANAPPSTKSPKAIPRDRFSQQPSTAHMTTVRQPGDRRQGPRERPPDLDGFFLLGRGAIMSWWQEPQAPASQVRKWPLSTTREASVTGGTQTPPGAQSLNSSPPPTLRGPSWLVPGPDPSFAAPLPPCSPQQNTSLPPSESFSAGYCEA